MSLESQLAALITAIGADIKAGKARGGPPSYVTAAVHNSFDSRFSIYNWKPSNTHKLRADLIKAAYAQALAEIVVIGDSFGAGCIASSPSVLYDRQNSYPFNMRREMARKGIPEGGTGMVRCNDDAQTQDTRWTFAGSGWTHTGLYYSFTASQNATATFTSDMPGTKVILTYVDMNDSATWTMAVNGATTGAGFSGTKTNNGGVANAIKQLALTLTINPGDTIVVKKTSASASNYLNIIGMQVVDTSRGGLVVHNLAQSGATASGTGAAAWVDDSAATSLGWLTNYYAAVTAGANANPHMIIELGGNDHPVPSGADSTHALYSTVTTALTTIRATSSGDAILMISGQLNDTIVPQANWEGYANACYQLADTLDLPLFDANAKMGAYSQLVSDGWITDGQGHWIAPAYNFLGRTLAAAIGEEFGNIQSPQILTVPTGTTIPTTTPNGTLIAKYTP